MAVVANKRSVMTLYHGSLDPYSHRVRIVLAEKGVNYDPIEIDDENFPEALLEINPYSSVPTLVDRDLYLHESEIIMEYLDERFPHPPLMPVLPVAKARSRLMLYRVNRDLYNLMNKILTKAESPDRDKARRALRDTLVSISPLFDKQPFFLSDEFSLVDCAIAPLLWRLGLMEIEIPPAAKAVQEYAGRLFERESFQVSLTDSERALAES
jgi:stringent starvation protein A